MKTISSIIIIFIMTIFLSGVGHINETEAKEKEFRGVWVSTVWNIDYPSKATTNEESLKKDAVKILDNVKSMGFNAVFLQVRSCSDALYDSEIYPWSKYLTGTQGIAPENNFDPLEFFIDEAHKRGIELHAWINPYRVTASQTDNNKLSSDNPAVKNPELTVLHTDGKLYLNPGEPEARKLIIDGVKEILDKYDVDGIHLDDYFYPGKEFDDADTYMRYGGSFSSLDEWRRNNNNILIKEIHEVIKKKDNVKFGVSPAGIWANKKSNIFGSDTDGWGTYENQFADSRLWVKEGYVDYIIPQIYWHIGYRIADYEKLVSWWADVVKGTSVKLYIGQAAYKAVNQKPESVWYNGNEIKKQIELNRRNNSVDGYCMFSYKSFMSSGELYDTIRLSNSELDIAPIGLSDCQLYRMNYNLPASKNKDYIVMYCDKNDKSFIIPRSRYVDGEVIGITNKKENLNVMYNEINFDDIENHPYRENIKYMAARKIILGYDGGFKPSLNIKRADFVLMLMRMLEINNIEGTSCFDDVSKSDYYCDELSTAKKLGLIQGVGNNMFRPEDKITRQDIFVMTYRAIKALKMIDNSKTSTSVLKFNDSSMISDYAVESISYFWQMEVLKEEDGSIKPIKIADRAETADFLANLLKSDIMMEFN